MGSRCKCCISGTSSGTVENLIFLFIPQAEEATPIQNQPQQMIGRATPQQKLGTVRKVTVAAAGPQQALQQQPDVEQCNRV